MTFFDWAAIPRNRPGVGEVAALGLRVNDRETLEWWALRFDERGVSHGAIGERNGRAFLPFTDPEGQRLELVEDGVAATIPAGTIWEGSPIPAERQIRGLSIVTLVVRELAGTEAVLVQVLGFRELTREAVAEGGEDIVYEVGPGGAGAQVRVSVRPALPHARQGAGGVHHVAFRTPSDEEHALWQRRIAATGLGVTPVIDRFYFKALYFREPGGILFEISTDGPGFATDEDVAHMGEGLALPPFLEPRRAAIEAGLQPLPTSAAATK